MIIGLGNDICEIAHVERTLERFGERFTQRCFTEIERAKSDRRRLRAASYAKRTMKLTGGAAAMLARLVPEGHRPHIHVSITDDNGMAQAFVIIEALPVDPARPLP